MYSLLKMVIFQPAMLVYQREFLCFSTIMLSFNLRDVRKAAIQLECGEFRFDSVKTEQENRFFLYSSDTNFEEDSSPFRFFGPKNGDLSHPNKITNLKLI